MMTPYFKDLDIPLGEFGLANNTLADKTFDHCRIHGTVVMYIGNNTTITLCSFDGNPVSSFIVTTNQYVSGVLGITGCTFINCTFDNVSFIGNQDAINKIKQGFNLTPAP